MPKVRQKIDPFSAISGQKRCCRAAAEVKDKQLLEAFMWKVIRSETRFHQLTRWLPKPGNSADKVLAPTGRRL